MGGLYLALMVRREAAKLGKSGRSLRARTEKSSVSRLREIRMHGLKGGLDTPPGGSPPEKV
jgi:hypothetical protein